MQVLLLIALLGSTSVTAEVLRLAGNAWPPYTDQRLLHSGLSVDLITTALGRAGYEVRYTEVPWERALRGLESGSYDLINGWPSESRARFAAVSRPFLTNRMRWVQRAEDDVPADGLHSLEGYAIALNRGYAYGEELTHNARLSIGYTTNFLQAARMLVAGRVDLTLEDERTAQFHFDRELADVSDQLSFVPGEYLALDLSLVVRKNHPHQAQIIEAFNREMGEMLEDGTYAAIFARHGLPVPAQLP